MELEEAILTRRTHKAFAPEPVPQETLEQLFALARWAPNHRLTNPWRFRVVRPQTLEALKRAAGAESAGKLDRAPTLVVVSAVRSPDDPLQEEEDVLATGVAAYIVLLAAHARGLAGYWRTPEVLRTPQGLQSVGIGETERFIGLLYLGRAREEKRAPERLPVDEVVRFLD